MLLAWLKIHLSTDIYCERAEPPPHTALSLSQSAVFTSHIYHVGGPHVSECYTLFNSVCRRSCDQKWVQVCWQVNPPEKNECAPCREGTLLVTRWGSSGDLSLWFISVVTCPGHNNEVPLVFFFVFFCFFLISERLLLHGDFRREAPLHNPSCCNRWFTAGDACKYKSCVDCRMWCSASDAELDPSSLVCRRRHRFSY